MTTQTVFHTLPPVIDPDSRVLILGSIPSPRSREAGFYYSHPQNRFWPLMAALFDEPVPPDLSSRRQFLHRHRIALWDVLARCDIAGADDGSIRNPVANPIEELLQKAEIRAVFTTGARAAALYRRYCQPRTGREALPLPSPSPANCRYHTFDSLLQNYRRILPFLAET